MVDRIIYSEVVTYNEDGEVIKRKAKINGECLDLL